MAPDSRDNDIIKWIPYGVTGESRITTRNGTVWVTDNNPAAQSTGEGKGILTDNKRVEPK